jgi:hypothetical protein
MSISAVMVSIKRRFMPTSRLAAGQAGPVSGVIKLRRVNLAGKPYAANTWTRCNGQGRLAIINAALRLKISSVQQRGNIPRQIQCRWIALCRA